MSKNCTLEEIAGLLLKNVSFVLCPHVSPDGDALGSTLALKMALEKAGKQVTVMVDDDVSRAFGFLPQLDSFVKPDVNNPVVTDLLVVLDASSLDRIGKVAQAVKYNAMVNIDHHISNTQYADYLYLNTEAAATGEILCALVEKLDGNLPLYGYLYGLRFFPLCQYNTGNYACGSKTVGIWRTPE